MTDRCETCNWWERLTYVERGHHELRTVADQVASAPVAVFAGWSDQDERDPRKDATSPHAFTVDGSDYWSALNTRADFGCIDFALGSGAIRRAVAVPPPERAPQPETSP